MTCKFFEETITKVSAIGMSGLPGYDSGKCKKMKESQKVMLAMNSAFYKMGIGSVSEDDTCPFRNNNNWQKCPLYEAM